MKNIMKKILLFFIISLLIACSNNNIKTNISLEEKKKLFIFISSIKKTLNNNDIEYLKKNMKNNLKNRYILKKMKGIYFPNFNIFISKPKFIENKNIADSMLGLNFNEETVYFKLYFIYENHSKKWLINTWEEIER